MTFVALLRAVNVGGTGKLSMATLQQLFIDAGFETPRTYIQSGNVVFGASVGEKAIRPRLEAALQRVIGKAPEVFLRTGEELQAVLVANPFAALAPSRVLVTFMHEAPAKDWREQVRGLRDEQLAAGKREIYAYFPVGAGQSKLKLPSIGTARNMNTVARLSELATQGA